MALDLNAELLKLDTGGANRPSFLEITKTTDVQAPDAGQSLLKVFQEAFPESDFTLTETEGKPTIRGMRKQIPPDANKLYPEGFSPKINLSGIEEMRKALESAITDEDKLSVSIKLLAMIATQKAYNFTNYKSRAELEYGVPELVTAIEKVRQAELASPFNPGTGMPSQQRLQLLETLGTARSRAAIRVKELSDSDISLAQSEHMAQATILEMEKGSLLAGRQLVREEKESRRIAKETAIGAMEPSFIQNISILRNARGDPTDTERRAIAEGLYDGKIKLTETERLLATATPDSIKAFYLVEKDQKKKEQALQLLAAKELAAAGNESQAKRNMDLFRKAYSIDVADITVTRDPTLSARVRQKNQQNIAAYPDKKTRDEVGAQDRVAFQNEYLNNVINQAFQSNVSEWQGVVQSDDTAKAVIKQMRAVNPKELNMRKFISEYLNFNDGKSLAEKSRAIQAITASALAAFPTSVVLPIPSEESIAMQTQRMLASSYVFSNVMKAYYPFEQGLFVESRAPEGGYKTDTEFLRGRK
jgi:hypothetical protein